MIQSDNQSLLLEKTLEEIMEETLVELHGMGISETDAGGVARLLLGIVNKRLATYYKTLKLNTMQAFVSLAKGQFLDKIGLLLDCKRRPEEINDDDAYRYRITKQINVVASANEIAIRLAALSVTGVQDVKLKRWTHGTGSFSVYVISENPITPQEILDQVQIKIDEVEAYGIRGEVFRPTIVPVEMRVRLIFDKTVPDLDRKLAIVQAEQETRNYVNSRNVGDPLSIEEITRLIKNVHSKITEVIFFYFRVNNRPALVVNQECSWNERFIESDKANAIKIA